MKIDFFELQSVNNQIEAELINVFKLTLNKCNYILGENVLGFEKSFADYCGVEYALGVGNGLDAIKLSLEALGIGKGDEVIVPSNTYIATALAVSHTGASPVFVEPILETFNIDSSKIEAAVTSRTKAIIPVHLYGQSCNMDDVLNVAKRNNLLVVEDNAQAQGATYKGKKTGGFGVINATSFYPTKNLGAIGDAGAITTNDARLFEKIKMLRNYGSEKKYYHSIIGYNSRLDELQAGFLGIKLKYLNEWNEQRRLIANQYSELLGNINGINTPLNIPDSVPVYHQYVIRSPKRNELQKYLSENNINTMIHYPVPPHLQKAYYELGYKKSDYPIAEEISETCLSLPMYPGLSIQKIEFITDTIIRFAKNKGNLVFYGS